MPIFNYILPHWKSGPSPVSDAPSWVIAAIERVLSRDPEGTLPVRVAEDAASGLTIAVLDHTGTLANPWQPRLETTVRFIHAVAADESEDVRLSAASARAGFESVYGAPLIAGVERRQQYFVELEYEEDKGVARSLLISSELLRDVSEPGDDGALSMASTAPATQPGSARPEDVTAAEIGEAPDSLGDSGPGADVLPLSSLLRHRAAAPSPGPSMEEVTGGALPRQPSASSQAPRRVPQPDVRRAPRPSASTPTTVGSLAPAGSVGTESTDLVGRSSVAPDSRLEASEVEAARFEQSIRKPDGAASIPRSDQFATSEAFESDGPEPGFSQGSAPIRSASPQAAPAARSWAVATGGRLQSVVLVVLGLLVGLVVGPWLLRQSDPNVTESQVEIFLAQIETYSDQIDLYKQQVEGLRGDLERLAAARETTSVQEPEVVAAEVVEAPVAVLPDVAAAPPDGASEAQVSSAPPLPVIGVEPDVVAVEAAPQSPSAVAEEPRVARLANSGARYWIRGNGVEVSALPGGTGRGELEPGRSYAVVGEVEVGGERWLELRQGWILRTARTRLTAEPPEGWPVSFGASGESVFAVVRRELNLRLLPTTELSEGVKLLSAGAVYPVLGQVSESGGTWYALGAGWVPATAGYERIAAPQLEPTPVAAAATNADPDRVDAFGAVATGGLVTAAAIAPVQPESVGQLERLEAIEATEATAVEAGMDSVPWDLEPSAGVDAAGEPMETTPDVAAAPPVEPEPVEEPIFVGRKRQAESFGRMRVGR